MASGCQYASQCLLTFAVKQPGTYFFLNQQINQSHMFKTHFFKISCLSIFVMLMCWSGSLFSQTGIQVKGKVTDDKDSAVANVSVVVKGTTTGTTTDESGNFTLSVPNTKATLVFSGVGFQSQEVALAD